MGDVCRRVQQSGGGVVEEAGRRKYRHLFDGCEREDRKIEWCVWIEVDKVCTNN